MADPQKSLKEATQDDPKTDALERKNVVLLQPAPARAAATFSAFLEKSGFSQGTRFKFLTEYIGAPIVSPDVAEGAGTLALLSDTTLKLSLSGKISLGGVTKLVAGILGEEVDDPEYLKQQLGVYPAPKNSDGDRPIKFTQTFEILNRTQIMLTTQNELPPAQLPNRVQDRSQRLLDFALGRRDDKPALDLPNLYTDDSGAPWFMRVWVDEPGLIKQVIGFRKPDRTESLQVRTTIEKG